MLFRIRMEDRNPPHIIHIIVFTNVKCPKDALSEDR